MLIWNSLLMQQAGKRFIETNPHRKSVDWVHVMKVLSDVLYPDAEVIVLVMDNLNAHKHGGHLSGVVSICGMDGDPQDLNLQTRMLREADVIVFNSNARAATFCDELLKGV
jgi:hypothetical protein